MKNLLKQHLDKAGEIIHNYHFWINIAIILSIIVLYYAKNTYYGDRIEWVWRLKTFEFTYRINGSLFYITLVYAAIYLWWKWAFLFGY